MSPLYYTLLAEAVDDGDPRTSTGSAGLAYSINTWVTKLAMGLTGFVLAQFLSQGHYVEAAVMQPPGLSAWITAGFVWLPLGAVCMQSLPVGMARQGMNILPIPQGVLCTLI